MSLRIQKPVSKQYFTSVKLQLASTEWTAECALHLRRHWDTMTWTRTVSAFLKSAVMKSVVSVTRLVTRSPWAATPIAEKRESSALTIVCRKYIDSETVLCVHGNCWVQASCWHICITERTGSTMQWNNYCAHKLTDKGRKQVTNAFNKSLSGLVNIQLSGSYVGIKRNFQSHSLYRYSTNTNSGTSHGYVYTHLHLTLGSLPGARHTGWHLNTLSAGTHCSSMWTPLHQSSLVSAHAHSLSSLWLSSRNTIL